MKLTDTHLIILAKAAQRDDRAVEFASDTDGAAAGKIAAKLLKARLIEEISARSGMPVWRQAEDGPLALRITDAGLKAINVDSEANAAAGAAAVGAAPGAKPSRRRSKAASEAGGGSEIRTGGAAQPKPRETKLDKVTAMLSRDGGATIQQLIKATGWLSHTTRAVLTGLRKRGHVIEREAAKGEPTVYRITGQVAGEGAQATQAA